MTLIENPWDPHDEPVPSDLTGGAVTMVDGQTFCLSQRSGDITGGAHGLFFADLRALSLLALRINGGVLQTLTGELEGSDAATFVLRTLAAGGEAGNRLMVIRRRHLRGRLEELIEIRNHGPVDQPATVTLHVGTDFADLFAVKEGRPATEGIRRTRIDRQAIVYSWRLDRPAPAGPPLLRRKPPHHPGRGDLAGHRPGPLGGHGRLHGRGGPRRAMAVAPPSRQPRRVARAAAAAAPAAHRTPRAGHRLRAGDRRSRRPAPVRPGLRRPARRRRRGPVVHDAVRTGLDHHRPDGAAHRPDPRLRRGAGPGGPPGRSRRPGHRGGAGPDPPRGPLHRFQEPVVPRRASRTSERWTRRRCSSSSSASSAAGACRTTCCDRSSRTSTGPWPGSPGDRLRTTATSRTGGPPPAGWPTRGGRTRGTACAITMVGSPRPRSACARSRATSTPPTWRGLPSPCASTTPRGRATSSVLAADLKERFNRDFWCPDLGWLAMGLDGDGRQIDALGIEHGSLPGQRDRRRGTCRARRRGPDLGADVVRVGAADAGRQRTGVRPDQLPLWIGVATRQRHRRGRPAASPSGRRRPSGDPRDARRRPPWTRPVAGTALRAGPLGHRDSDPVPDVVLTAGLVGGLATAVRAGPPGLPARRATAPLRGVPPVASRPRRAAPVGAAALGRRGRHPCLRRCRRGQRVARRRHPGHRADGGPAASVGVCAGRSRFPSSSRTARSTRPAFAPTSLEPRRSGSRAAGRRSRCSARRRRSARWRR